MKVRGPRTRTFTWEGIRPDHVSLWRKYKWPCGIRTDLAFSTPYRGVGVKETLLMAKFQRRPLVGHTVSTSDGGMTVHLSSWWYPHPRTTWPERPQWQRLPMFTIGAAQAGAWLFALIKLDEYRQAHPEGSPGRQYVHEIRYGQAKCVRFALPGGWCLMRTFYDSKVGFRPTPRFLRWDPRVAPEIMPAMMVALNRANLLHGAGEWQAVEGGAVSVVDESANFECAD